jgi:hypothetical protein
MLKFIVKLMPYRLIVSRPGQAFLYHVVYRYWCPGGPLTVRECIRRGECGCSNRP